MPTRETMQRNFDVGKTETAAILVSGSPQVPTTFNMVEKLLKPQSDSNFHLYHMFSV